MDNKLLAGSTNWEELRKERDSLHSDLKTLDSSLETLTGKKISALTQAKGTKRSISVSDSTNSRDGSPSPVRTKKLSSVLVKPCQVEQDKRVNENKRKAILESQRNDKQVFDRNKRMFGMLMGTLQRFKKEETDRELSTIKRSLIEEKLDQAVEEEKATVSKEVVRILELKQQKETLLSKAELKLDVVGRFKNWENTNTHLCNYIQTETKPKIFWLPKEHNAHSEKRFKETRDYFSICVAERAAKFKKELDDLELNSVDLSKSIEDN